MNFKKDFENIKLHINKQIKKEKSKTKKIIALFELKEKILLEIINNEINKNNKMAMAILKYADEKINELAGVKNEN